MSRAPGSKLGPYEIVGPIGRGGMGEVYRARDLRLGREVAIKVLPERLASDRHALLRFEREAKAVASLSHPNILTLHDIGARGGQPYAVTELLEGESLRDRIRSRGSLPWLEGIAIAVAVAKGLKAAHSKGVIHRDIKPSNIFITADDHVKILDFGIARFDPKHAQGGLSNLSSTVGTGAMVGTIAYMAPEQLNGGTADVRSDIFSFGVVLYQMLTGKHPFRRDTLVNTIMAVVNDEPPPLLAAGAVCPAELEPIVARCLAKDPDDRYQDAGELVLDLSQMVGTGTATVTVTQLTLPRRRRPVMTAVALLFLVLLLTVVLWWVIPPRSTSTVVEARRAAAVLELRNLSPNPEAAWLSTALAEMVGMELATGGAIRLIPGIHVTRMMLDQPLLEGVEAGTEVSELAAPTLARVRRVLGADLVLLGSYLVLGEPGARQIRVNLTLQDTRRGETLVRLSEQGSDGELFAVVEALGAAMRTTLGLETAAGGDARRAISASTDATRLYAEGLALLRRFEYLEARAHLEAAVAADGDFALARKALAQAQAALGYDREALAEASRAAELAKDLPREERLQVEGFFQERSRDWTQAVRIYESLSTFFPDNIDYGQQLANAQLAAGLRADAEHTLAALRALPAPLREDPRIDLVAADIAEARSDFATMVIQARQAARKGEEMGGRLLVGEALRREGIGQRNLGEIEAAMAAYRRALTIFRDAKDPLREAYASQVIGLMLSDRGAYGEAEPLYQQALATYRQIGHRSSEALVLSSLASQLWKQGRPGRAHAYAEEAITVARAIGHKRREAVASNNLGFILRDLGALSEAVAAFDRSRALFEDIGLERGIAWYNYGMGRVALDRGQLEEAEARLREAEALYRGLDLKPIAGYVETAYGDLEALRGAEGAARQRYGAALEVRDALGEAGRLAETRLRMASLALEGAQGQEALGLARIAAQDFAQQGADAYWGVARAIEARALAAAGDVEAAMARLAEALALVAESDHLAIRLQVELAAARLAEPAASRARAAAVRDEAVTAGLVPLALEARLVDGRAQLAAGQITAGQNALQTLAEEARRLGLEGLARRAAALAEKGSGDVSSVVAAVAVSGRLEGGA